MPGWSLLRQLFAESDFSFKPSTTGFYAAIDQHDRFRQLARQLDVALSPLGFGREQSFIPHITLARIKGARHLSLLRSELKGMELKAPSFPVAGLTLYSSILHPLGVRYDVLYRSRFQSF